MSSMPYITRSASGLDLSPRFTYSTAVAASPSGSTETTICTITVSQNVAVETGILLIANASYTVGTSGVSANFRLRQTGTSGTIIAATGANTVVAGNLYTHSLHGLDTAAVLPGQVYVLTMTVGSGAATSTVSGVRLSALVV